VPASNESIGFQWHHLAPGLSWAELSDTISSAGSRWTFPSKGSVWLWLNRGGSGLLWGNKDRFILKPGMYALTGGGNAADWTCLRYPGSHNLEVVLIDPRWLKDRMGRSLLHPDLKEWLTNDCPVAFCGLMGVWENELFEALSGIPASPGPEKFLAEAKILQWAAIRLFRASRPSQAPAFCASMRERNPVPRALAHLATNLDKPLDLAALAHHAGIAPHYLSRKTRAETGLTLQRHLRRLRIERACEQLLSGETNITETALDVGYQSISHFAKAFREETGSPPREWLASRKASR
jgi:AraC-like DNA-binding protein